MYKHMTIPEREQLATLTKESLVLVNKIHKELSCCIERRQAPTLGGIKIILENTPRLKELSVMIAWLASPALTEEEEA